MAAAQSTTATQQIDTTTNFLSETRALVADVGPAWGLVLVVAVCLFIPRIGVLVHLAALLKEDRADDRKRKVESERLLVKYRNRPDVRKGLPAPRKED